MNIHEQNHPWFLAMKGLYQYGDPLVNVNGYTVLKTNMLFWVQNLENAFKLFGFHSSDFERTWWRLFQSRVDIERTWWRLFQSCVDIERTWWKFLQSCADIEPTWWRLLQSRVDIERTWWKLLQSRVDLERTWWRLFQKLVVRTNFDIYDFIYTEIYWSTDTKHFDPKWVSKL